jgi:phage terminase large subunit GpA-like protein
MIDATELYASAYRAGLAPEPELTVDAWADANRYLSPGEANEHGKYETSRTPYLRDIMRALSIGETSRTHVVMKGAQLGLTQLAINWIGYIIEHTPAPILFYLPTRELAQQTSETRIDPMFEGTPVLRDRVPAARSRDKRNTTFKKEFVGGSLLMRGANSAAAFRNVSARFLILDDLDGWPGEVGTEGDPVTLIRKRALTYPNMKELDISTPTIRDLSRIERGYLAGDQRRYFIPCPFCGHKDFLTWTGYRDFAAKRDPGHHRIEWPEDRPEAAAMTCGRCGKRVEEDYKNTMLEGGEWRPLAPGPGRDPSWHISGLYAPYGWGSWGDAATEWTRAQGNPLQLKGFINTTLAETYEDRAQGAEAEPLLERLERYPAPVPDGVGVLVAGVDVQGDRLEVLVKGYGAAFESWLIAWEAFAGDPNRDDVWFEVDEFLKKPWKHASGRELRVECAAVDSNYLAEKVYSFCSTRRHRRVYAVRGINMVGRPIIDRPGRNNPYRMPVYGVCTDTAKLQIFARLHIPLPEAGKPAPGCMHFPDAAWVNAEYFAQLTAEKGLWKYVKGKGSVRVWTKTRERNEALDLEVYALAALHIRGASVIANLANRAARFSERMPAGAVPAAPVAAGQSRVPAVRSAIPGRQRGWVKGWRR